MELRTERLLLRPGRPEDLEPLHGIFSDPAAMRYWDRHAYTELSETQRFLNGFMSPRPDAKFEFILEFEGRCIGKAGVWEAPQIGYILHPDCWGKGLASEALSAILPGAFRHFADLPALTAEVDPRNTKSILLLERLGFRQTGLEEKNFLYGDSEWCDTAYFQLDRADLAAPQDPGVTR